MSSADVARAVLETVGTLTGPVAPLADGMSSSAWVGRVDGAEWVARIPKNDGLRPTPRYREEVALLDALLAGGVPVPPTTIVDLDGMVCTVAPRVIGEPVTPDGWTDEIVADIASALFVLHSLSPDLATEDDVVARFHLARIWPFDGLSLEGHAVQQLGAEVVRTIEAAEESILAAGSAPAGVVHTDLHWDHMLVGVDGRLAGFLDFGDAFAGPAAWDFACLRYYHGDDVAQRVANVYPGGAAVIADSGPLGIAWALYKLDKTPDRPEVAERVMRLAT